MTNLRRIACGSMVMSCFASHVAIAQPTPDTVEPPRIRTLAPPVYPATVAPPSEPVEVTLELEIDVSGEVRDARVVTSSAAGYDAIATDVMRRSHFVPAKRAGEPIAVRIRYRYVFDAVRPETMSPSPSTGRLEGRVLDRSNGMPLANASVRVLSQEGTTLGSRTTDEEGAYDFGRLEEGTYRIECEAVTHSLVVGTAEIRSGYVTDLALRLSKLETGDEYSAVAHAEAPAREVTRRTMKREAVTQVAGTRGDTLRAVELLPGVARAPLNSGVLVVRGSSPEDTEVQVDGVPVLLLYHFGGITSFYNAQMLDSVTLFPSNFSVRYGRKIGGIVEVDAREPTFDRLRAVADVNLVDASLFLQVPVSNRLSVAAAARRSYIDFFYDAVAPNDGATTVAAPVYWDWQTGATYKATHRDTFRILGFGSSDRFRLVLERPNDGLPAIRGNVGLSQSFHRTVIGYRRRWSDTFEQDLQVGAGLIRTQAQFGELGEQDIDGYELFGRGEWKWDPAPFLTLVSGIDVTSASARVDYTGPRIRQTEGNPGADVGIAVREPATISRRYTVPRPAAYVEARIRPLDALTLIPGLRADYFGDIDRVAVDPRLVARLQVHESTLLKAGVGHFSQPPDLGEALPGLGNPKLDFEKAIHASAGVEQTVSDLLTFGVEGYYKHLYDLIVGTEDGLAPHLVNDGTGRIYGLELAARIHPGHRFFGFVSYGLSRSERRDHEGSYRLFDYDQPHVLTTSVGYDLGSGWQVSGTYRLVSGTPLTPARTGVYDADQDLYRPLYGDVNSDRNPLFHRLDLRVQKTWNIDPVKLSVYLDVQNAYNARNRESYVYSYDYRTVGNVYGLPILPVLGLRGEL